VQPGSVHSQHTRAYTQHTTYTHNTHTQCNTHTHTHTAFTCCKSIRSNLRSRDTLRCIKEQYRESERRRGVGDDGLWKECLNVCMRVHFPPFPVRLAKLIRPRAPLPRGHRWLAELRGLEPNSIASVEHIQLAEVLSPFACTDTLAGHPHICRSLLLL